MRWPLFDLVKKPLDALATSTLMGDGERASLQDAPDVPSRKIECLRATDIHVTRRKQAGWVAAQKSALHGPDNLHQLVYAFDLLSQGKLSEPRSITPSRTKKVPGMGLTICTSWFIHLKSLSQCKLSDPCYMNFRRNKESAWHEPCQFAPTNLCISASKLVQIDRPLIEHLLWRARRREPDMARQFAHGIYTFTL